MIWRNNTTSGENVIKNYEHPKHNGITLEAVAQFCAWARTLGLASDRGLSGANWPGVRTL